MNAYEKKFKDKFIETDIFIHSLRDQVEIQKKAMTHEKSRISSLRRTLEMIDEPNSVKVINSAIDDREKILAGYSNYKVKLEADITKAKDYFDILKSLCPHEEMVYDHTCYHKNEDYHKCTLCGVVI